MKDELQSLIVQIGGTQKLVLTCFLRRSKLPFAVFGQSLPVDPDCVSSVFDRCPGHEFDAMRGGSFLICVKGDSHDRFVCDKDDFQTLKPDVDKSVELEPHVVNEEDASYLQCCPNETNVVESPIRYK